MIDPIGGNDIEGKPLSDEDREKLRAWFEEFETNLPKGAIVYYYSTRYTP